MAAKEKEGEALAHRSDGSCPEKDMVTDVVAKKKRGRGKDRQVGMVVESTPPPPRTLLTRCTHAWRRMYDPDMRERIRAHFGQSLGDLPGDPVCKPFHWSFLLTALWSSLILTAAVVASAHIVLSGGVVLLWFLTPASTLLLCIQARACWPYTFTAIVGVELTAVCLGHGRISRDSLAAFIIIVVDLLNISLGTLLLRPLVAGSIHIVRTSTFVRYLVLYVLLITPAFSLVNGGIIVLLPSNNITWMGGRQLVVAWLLGDFFATYFTVYAVLVFRYTIAQATKDTYRWRDLAVYLQARLRAGGIWLYLRVVEYAGVLVVTYMVAHAVATSSTSPRDHLGPRIVSRLMIPLLGFVTFRFGQFGSCVALIVAAAGIFTVTYGQLDRGDRLTDIFYQIDLLLGPIVVVLITWSMTFLAVALAEKQDGLSLLEKRNFQLLVQGRELQQAKLEAQRALSAKTEFFARVSYEFRTPLNIILGFAEEIKRQDLPPYVQERIGYIITSGESLLRIVDDILELFRLSSQRLQIDESLVDIHAYFTTMCDLVQVITDKSQRRLERVQDPSLPRYVFLDKIRFSQLVMNLSSNAAKSTGTGGRIVLRLRQVKGRGKKGGKGVLMNSREAREVRGREEREGKGVLEVEEKGVRVDSHGGAGGGKEPGEVPGEERIGNDAVRHKKGPGNEKTSPKIGSPKKEKRVAEGKGIGKSGRRRSHRVIWLRLEVEDDGIGIPKSTQNQIFNCFYSGNQLSGGEKGHGLGLAITKELVDLMKGSIEVVSDVGVGSLFTVDLPVKVLEEEEGKHSAQNGRHLRRRPRAKRAGSPAGTTQDPEGNGQDPAGVRPPARASTRPLDPARATDPDRDTPPALSSPAPTLLEGDLRTSAVGVSPLMEAPSPFQQPLHRNRRLHGLRIMAVEDLLPNQMVLGGMLREDSHSVQFVETAFGALEMLSRHPGHFDVALLDIELPDAHGVTVLTRIRSHPSPRIAGMPVVVVTAVAMDGERNRCYRHGADDFVTKPIRLGTLRASLLALYKRGRIKPREGIKVVEDGKEDNA